MSHDGTMDEPRGGLAGAPLDEHVAVAAREAIERRLERELRGPATQDEVEALCRQGCQWCHLCTDFGCCDNMNPEKPRGERSPGSNPGRAGAHGEPVAAGAGERESPSPTFSPRAVENLRRLHVQRAKWDSAVWQASMERWTPAEWQGVLRQLVATRAPAHLVMDALEALR